MLFENEESMIAKRARKAAAARDEARPVTSDVPPVPPAPEIGSRSILEGRRTRLVREEEEEVRPVRRRARAHSFFWPLVAVVLIAAVVIVIYGYWAVAAYHGQMNLLPALQSQLIADGHRIDAAGQALQDQKATFGQRLANAGSMLAGRLQPPPTRAELEQRTAALQGQINTLQSAQQSADQRLNALQGQLNQVTSQPPPVPLASQPNPPSNPVRIDFTANLNQSHELSPGIRLNITRIDASHQRYDASVKLTGGQTLWLHSRPLQEPVKFYNAGDSAPDELVVTQITRNSVAGYLQLAQAPPVASNSAAESR